LPALEADGQHVTPSFKETKSIWYHRKLIEKGGAADRGLIGYGECLRRNAADPLKEITVYFGAYPTNGAYPYQLTLLFYFRQESDSTKEIKSDVFSLSNVDLIGGDTTDTGSPCPPDVGCSVGSLFPLP
jgi:hypothetical protein